MADTLTGPSAPSLPAYLTLSPSTSTLSRRGVRSSHSARSTWARNHDSRMTSRVDVSPEHTPFAAGVEERGERFGELAHRLGRDVLPHYCFHGR